MAVQVVAGPVAAHCGSRVSVTGGDLDISEVNAGVEHGRDESTAEHMRVRPGGMDASGYGELAQAAAGTAGRRTCSAGECSRMPSMTQVR